jgi:hypothetical protein
MDAGEKEAEADHKAPLQQIPPRDADFSAADKQGGTKSEQKTNV